MFKAMATIIGLGIATQAHATSVTYDALGEGAETVAWMLNQSSDGDDDRARGIAAVGRMQASGVLSSLLPAIPTVRRMAAPASFLANRPAPGVETSQTTVTSTPLPASGFILLGALFVCGLAARRFTRS